MTTVYNAYSDRDVYVEGERGSAGNITIPAGGSVELEGEAARRALLNNYVSPEPIKPTGPNAVDTVTVGPAHSPQEATVYADDRVVVEDTVQPSAFTAAEIAARTATEPANAGGPGKPPTGRALAKALKERGLPTDGDEAERQSRLATALATGSEDPNRVGAVPSDAAQNDGTQ